MAELADAADLGSVGWPWEFESLYSHSVGFGIPLTHPGGLQFILQDIMIFTIIMLGFKNSPY